MEFFLFFFLILFPFPSYHIQLSNSILCKAFSGTGMCVWWINQQTLKKTAVTVSCSVQVGLSARCGRLHFPPSGLVFCTPQCGEVAEEKNRRQTFFTSRTESLSWSRQTLLLLLLLLLRVSKHAPLPCDAGEFLVNSDFFFKK